MSPDEIARQMSQQYGTDPERARALAARISYAGVTPEPASAGTMMTQETRSAPAEAPVPKAPRFTQTELAYHRHLDARRGLLRSNGIVLSWSAECCRWKVGETPDGRGVWYRPDVTVWREELSGTVVMELHEVKARDKAKGEGARRKYRAEDDALVKLGAMATLYPFLPLVVVWPDPSSPTGWAEEWRTR